MKSDIRIFFSLWLKFAFIQVTILWVFGGRRGWYMPLWSEMKVGWLVRPKAVQQLSQQPNASNLERNPVKAYFHILYSTFSYFIFCQTQFKTSFRAPPFIRGIHFAIRIYDVYIRITYTYSYTLGWQIWTWLVHKNHQYFAFW